MLRVYFGRTAHDCFRFGIVGKTRKICSLTFNDSANLTPADESVVKRDARGFVFTRIIRRGPDPVPSN